VATKKKAKSTEARSPGTIYQVDMDRDDIATIILHLDARMGRDMKRVEAIQRKLKVILEGGPTA
tara:strand:- start:11718 stop:11909 length:192 start_codon:yes stop_codon:yes gene_type:complete